MLSLDDLLEPVPGDHPQGTDERGSEAYARLASAVRRARLAEASEQPPKPETWSEVARDAVAILRDKSKNLHVAAMLTEAVVRSDGFAGLQAGAQLIDGLIARYWDVLYPVPYPGENDDVVAARLKPLQELGTVESMLVIPLRKRELFQLDNGVRLSLTACLQARDPAREGRPGHKPWAAIASEAVQTQAEPIQATIQAIASARIAWLTLSGHVQPHTGGRPLGRPLVELLDQALSLLHPLVPSQPHDASAVGAAEGSAAATTGKRPGAQDGFADREEALRALSSISGWFRRMEPGSPLGATLDEAVRRARLSWVELMGEVVTDRQAREQLLHRLGIRPPE